MINNKMLIIGLLIISICAYITLALPGGVCNDGMCTGDETNISSALYCPVDCGVYVNESSCVSTFVLDEDWCVGDYGLDRDWCEGEYDIHRTIVPLYIDNSAEGTKTGNSGTGRGVWFEKNLWIFLIIGFVIGYKYKERIR